MPLTASAAARDQVAALSALFRLLRAGELAVDWLVPLGEHSPVRHDGADRLWSRWPAVRHPGSS